MKSRIPHTRGGEPATKPILINSFDVFPTRVGVNRTMSIYEEINEQYSPHAWG